ncbi:MAG: AraC family transcriptional regulator [Bacteroidota bacterium]
MFFEFNAYSSLLLICFVQGLLFACLYFYRGFKKEELHPKLLACILLMYSAFVANWMLGFAGWYDSHDWRTILMFYFPWRYWLALGPLTWFYFRSLTNRNFGIKGKDWFHFLPVGLYSLIEALVAIWDLIVIGELPYFYGTKGAIMEEGFWGEHIYYPAVKIVTIFSIFYYFIKTLRAYNAYRIYLDNNFSETTLIHFSWLRNVLYIVLVGQILRIVFEIAELTSPNGLTYIQTWWEYLGFGLMIYYLSISAYNERPFQANYLVFDLEKEAVNKEKTEKEKTALDTVDLATKQRILDHMEQSKIYLNDQLTLSELAKGLSLHPNQLSRIINLAFQKNFNEFVNYYRVEAAKEKLVDPNLSHLSILGIAYECGFRSKATFNRAFKSATNLSPNNWKKQRQNA